MNKCQLRSFLVSILAVLSLVVPTGTANANDATVLLKGSAWLGGAGVGVCKPGTSGKCDRLNAVGMQWQCVEMAQRLYDHKGWHSGLFPVNFAREIFSKASDMDMTRQVNGKITAISPGDMIIHDRDEPGSLGAGHVSVVDRVDGEMVHAVEQNAYGNTPRAVYALKSGTLSRTGSGTLLGIVHDPDNRLASAGVSSVESRYHRNLNGGGGDDILMYGPGNARDVVLYGNTGSGGPFMVNDVDIKGNYDRVVKADFNGDKIADLLFYGRGSKHDALWYGTKTRGVFDKASDLTVNGDYDDILAGDFNGDGRGDLVFYGAGSKPDATWFGSGSKGVWDKSKDTVVSGGGYLPQVGDFNGDGRFDVLWYRRDGSGSSLWYGTDEKGVWITRSLSIGAGYVLVVGDFDGTGKDDVLFYGRGSKRDTMWFGSGDKEKMFATGFDIEVNGTNYLLVAGDFNGDKRGDVLFYRRGTGGDSVWFGTDTKAVFETLAASIDGVYDPV